MTGRKYDGDKAPVARGVLAYFPRAVKAVSLLSKYGKEKYETTYEEQNYAAVEDGIGRYTDAMVRHYIEEGIEGVDPETDMHHSVAVAWNALARLELILREQESAVEGVRVKNFGGDAVVDGQVKKLPGIRLPYVPVEKYYGIQKKEAPKKEPQ